MTLETPVALRLRVDVLAGEFAPGRKLVEETLVRRYGAPRSAVRAALALLEHDGLVIHETNLGARVRMIGPDEASDISLTSAVLKRAAITRMSGATTPDARTLLDLLAHEGRAVRGGTVVAAVEALRMLRSALFGAGGAASAELIGLLEDRRLLFLQRFDTPQKVVSSAHRHHRTLVRSVVARDVASALSAVDRGAELGRSRRAAVWPGPANAVDFPFGA